MIHLIYPLLAFLLFWKAERVAPDAGGSDACTLPGKARTKPLLGFFAVCILLHHLSQKTCAPWIPAEYRQTGLEPFVPLGYLFVSFFFFVSGLGLWKSLREKEDYLESFADRRIFPLLVTFVLTEFLYLLARSKWGSMAFPENGYSWYVFAILIFYLLFYYIRRFCPAGFLPLMTLGIVLYCLVCYSLVTGEWWFNSAPAFLAGLIAGRCEKRTAECLRKPPAVITLLALAVITAAAAEHPEWIRAVCGNELSAGVTSNLQLFLRMAAAVFFPLLMTAFLLRVKVGNRVLDFLGSLTLEFYLVQGLFVEIFGYCFIEIGTAPVCYIRSIPLYCLVVFALTVPSAWLVRKACTLSADRLRHSGFARMVLRDVRVLARVLAVLAVAVTAFMAVRTRITAGNMEERIRAYRQQNLTAVSVGGTQTAVSVTGQGSDTLVLLGNVSDPCPSMLLQELAEKLAPSRTVVTVDRPGTGFSDDTEADRSAENIAAELHETLCLAGVDSPVILVANGASGLYALEYAKLYPDEVRAFIGIDAYGPAWGEYMQNVSGYEPEEYIWRMERIERSALRLERLAHFLGFDRWGLYPLDMLNHGLYRVAEPEILNELYLTGSISRATGNERKGLYENALHLAGEKYPENLPCLFLLHYALTDNGENGPDWEQITQSMISNGEIQKTVIVAGDPYGIYTDPAPLAEQIIIYLDENMNCYGGTV